MKYFFLKPVLLILMQVTTIPGTGQRISDSLLVYLETADRNNPYIKQKFNEYRAALQKVPQAGSLPDPELTLGILMKPMELINGSQVADVRLMQMFPWFGVLRNAKDEMSLMAKAKFEALRDARLQLFYEVRKTWYELYKIRKEISVSVKNLSILESVEQIALAGFRSSSASDPLSGFTGLAMNTENKAVNNSQQGTGMQRMTTNAFPTGSSPGHTSGGQAQMAGGVPGSGLTDLNRIKIEKNELKNSIASMRDQEKYLIAVFNSYLDRHSGQSVFTDTILTAICSPFLTDEVTDSVRYNNPMLSMIELEKKAYSARAKMAAAMGYPMTGLGVAYTVIGKNGMSVSGMNGKDMIMPMVSVTLPLYRKKYNSTKKEAEFLGQAAESSYQAAVLSLEAEVIKAVQAYNDADRRVKLYDDLFSIALTSFELTLKNFSTSASNLTDVLRMYQQTLDYELKSVEAVADLYTAEAWLQRLMAVAKTQ